MLRTIALILTFVLFAGEAAAERRVALVIGNAAYEKAAPLANPANDARAVSSVLRDMGFDVVFGLDLTQDGMKMTIRKFAQRLEGADVGLFYYAGHGLQVKGVNYLVPIDAGLESELDLTFEATELMFVLGLMERKVKTTLAFLDACRDNPLARTLARSMGSTRSTAIGRGLARVETGVGTLIVYATAPGNVALDGDTKHSPFTNALLEYMPQEGLEVRQMLTRVRQTVHEDTNGFQVPWDHSSLIGDFYFAGAAAPQTASLPPASTAPPPPAAPRFDDRALELAFWETIKDSDNPADYRDYLARYPDGVFASLAKRKLGSLDRSAAPPQPQPTFDIEEMDLAYVAKGQANVRAGPSAAYDKVGVLESGQEVGVTGKIKGENWYRIALAGGGMGYVYGAMIRERVDPGAATSMETALRDVDPVDGDFFAVVRANVRATPSRDGTKLGVIEPGRQVEVLGAVKGRNWYLLGQEGAPYGYVYGELIAQLGGVGPSASGKIATAQPVPRSTSNRPQGVRVFNVMPVIHRGRRLDQLTATLQRALADVPGSMVVSEPNAIAPEDTVVTVVITRDDQQVVENPEFKSAQMARALFGGLGQMVTQGVASHVAVHTAHVAVTARQGHTGPSITETGVNETTEDSVKAGTWIGDAALQRATEDAAGRLIIRLAGGTPPAR